MNERQKAAYEALMRAMLDLPENERGEVIDALRFNDVFCLHCGYGTPEHPNADCQCWNDE